MIAVQITHHIKPEHVDRYIEATLANGRATRQESGNLRFDLLRNADDHCTFHLYEVYVDRAAHQAHLTSPHFAAWKAAVAGVFERATIQKPEAMFVV